VNIMSLTAKRRVHWGWTRTVVAAMVALIVAPAIVASGQEVVGRWPEGPTQMVARIDNVALIPSGRVVRTYDVSDPTEPAKLGSVVLPGAVVDADVANGYAYTTVKGVGLVIVDVRDPAAPVLVPDAVYPVPGVARTVTVAESTGGDFVLVTVDDDHNGALVVFLMVSPTELFEGWRVEGTHQSPILDVAVHDGLVYVVDTKLRVFEIPPHVSTELGSVDVSVWGTKGVAVADDRAYIGSIVGSTFGTEHYIRVFDVSDPENPVPLLPSTQQGSAIGLAVDPAAGVVASAGPDLYLTSTDDAPGPGLIGEYRGGDRPTDLSLASGVVIAAYYSTGAHLVDISDPTAPTALAIIESVGEPRGLR
jgi:hypothetical protein